MRIKIALAHTIIIPLAILLTAGCSVLPDSLKSDRQIAGQLVDCQIRNDPEFGAGLFLLGGKDEYVDLLSAGATKEELIAERDRECALASPTPQATEASTPSAIGFPVSTLTPEPTPTPTVTPFPTSTPTPVPTPTPIPVSLLSAVIEYDPAQTKRERGIDCGQGSISQLKITSIPARPAIADAAGNIFAVVAVRTSWVCRSGIRSELVLEPEAESGNWTGYTAEWRTPEGVIVGNASGPQFALELWQHAQPEYLSDGPLAVYLYDGETANLAPTPVPVSKPTPDETEVTFRYDPADYVRPRGQTGVETKTVDIRDQNLTISDVNGNRWQVAEINAYRTCITRYNFSSSCKTWGKGYRVKLINNTRSYPNFTEYRMTMVAENEEMLTSQWNPESARGQSSEYSWNIIGEAYFGVRTTDTSEKVWTVEIFDAYQRE